MSRPQLPHHPREPVNPRFRVSFHHLREIALEEGNFGKELEDQEGCFKGEVYIRDLLQFVFILEVISCYLPSFASRSIFVMRFRGFIVV